MIADLHPYALYWDRGVQNVPDMTGAKRLLDARDLMSVCGALGFDVPIKGMVCDIGCGTGRMAQLCEGYHGFDIAQSAVAYCLGKGIEATLITGPAFFAPRTYDLVSAISVFTHIDRAERQQYLQTMARLSANVLVDIIPGDGTGEVALWTADPAEFEADVRAAGFVVVGSVDHQWDLHLHRYYRLRRVA